jgi:hypothetical protein
MENLNEHIERISEIMGINPIDNIDEQLKSKNVGKVTSKATSRKVAGKSAAKSSVQKTASKSRGGKPTTKKPTTKKTNVLNDPTVTKTLEETLGTTLSKKARKEFEGMPDSEIVQIINNVKSGKLKNYPKTIQDKLDAIYKRDPKWLERWSNRVKGWPIKKQGIFWGTVLFGGVFVLGVISESGLSGLYNLMKTPIDYIYSMGGKTGEFSEKMTEKQKNEKLTKDAENWFKENDYWSNGMTFEVQGDGILWKTPDGNKGYVQKQNDGSYK